MSEPVRNIKDRTPNQNLIEVLESYLAQAKAGDVRSMVFVCGWNDDGVTHCWRHDARNNARKLLSELVICQHELITAIGLKDGDSVLSEALEGH